MKYTVCVVGLGYVGLPLAHTFARKKYTVLGYDISDRRVKELLEGHDRTNELTDKQLRKVTITYSSDPKIIEQAAVIIVALPTPVDDRNKPDLSILKAGSKTVGKHLQKGSIVVYESTVYPGTTEEICGPILERESGLACGKDFFLGYSHERINPGDREHPVSKIQKNVAGQDEKTTDTLCELYGSVIKAGIHRAPNIKVAEMAKAIENAQRDLNIAFVNEVAMLCHRIGICTQDVLEAAKTKWNFLPFQPGLVGGHCIGVDPYYLVEKAEQLGMETQVITAGRAINDNMSKIVAQETIDALGVDPKGARILVLGLAFKPDIPDTRNSKSFDVVRELEQRGCNVRAHDPHIGEEEYAKHDIRVGNVSEGPYDGILILVAHKEYVEIDTQTFIDATKEEGLIYDLKSVLDRGAIEDAGRKYLAL